MKRRRSSWGGAVAVVLAAAGAVCLSVSGARAQVTELGTGASATGDFAVAIGTGATASGEKSVMVGSFGTASGDFSTAIGESSNATGDKSIAVGNGAGAAGENAVAMGYFASASVLDAVALGNGAQATHVGSVALGSGSATGRGALTGYTAPYLTTPQTSTGEVSVGTVDGQRQITNVAAGSQATDAVNLAQLQGAVDPLRADLDVLTGRVDRLGARIEDVRDIAIAAGALAMAAAQLRFDDRPGKLSIAMGGGAFHGKGAGAIGIGYTSPDKLWRANISGSFTDGEAAFGGGLSFTLN